MTEKFSYKGQILTALIPGIGLPIVLLSALYTIRRVSKRFGGMLCFYLIWAAGAGALFAAVILLCLYGVSEIPSEGLRMALWCVLLYAAFLLSALFAIWLEKRLSERYAEKALHEEIG